MSLKPAPLCFSCGKKLPEELYEEYHNNIESGMKHSGIMKWFDTKGLIRPCCRRMVLGDSKELRDILLLYDESTLNDCPKL